MLVLKFLRLQSKLDKSRKLLLGELFNIKSIVIKKKKKMFCLRSPRSIFHTVLFHRSFGKFTYQDDSSYIIGTIGYEDVDCDYIGGI